MGALSTTLQLAPPYQGGSDRAREVPAAPESIVIAVLLPMHALRGVQREQQYKRSEELGWVVRAAASCSAGASFHLTFATTSSSLPPSLPPPPFLDDARRDYAFNLL